MASKFVWDRSMCHRHSGPRNAEPWAVVSRSGTVVETWCTRERAAERAEELSAEYYPVEYRVARAEVV